MDLPRDGSELYRIYSLRHTYEEKERQIVANLIELGMPKIISLLRSKKIETTKYDLPYPLNEITEKLIDQNITFLKQAKILRDIAISSDPLVKPILYYYSERALLAFFINSLVDVQQPKYHHGLAMKNLDACDKAIIHFQDTGFLPKTLDVFSIIGINSLFSPRLWSNNEFMKNNRPYACVSDRSLSIRELLEADLGGYHLSHDIRNFILLFAASNFARYNPVVWNRILGGYGTDLNLTIEKTYSEFDAFFYKILAALECIIAKDLKFLEFIFRCSAHDLLMFGVQKYSEFRIF